MTETGALTDEQLVTWLTDGYLVLQPEQLGEADHRFFYDRAADLYDLSRATASPTTHLDHLGDNLLAQIPELDRLLTDPVIDGALESILGPDYLIHPHSYCHRSSGRDQVFHQDGNLPWNERGHYRAHRPDWAMLFYYPQDVDDLNGPTEVVPGTQYWTIDHETADGDWHRGDRIDRSIDEAVMAADDLTTRDRLQHEGLERGLGLHGLERRFLHLRAGSVLIAHYDLVHRGSRTTGRRDDRYLYKFYFARVKTPSPATEPSPTTPGADRPDLDRVRSGLHPVVASNWAWLHGQPPTTTTSTETRIDVAAMTDLLLRGNEEEKVEASYRLGRAATGDDDRPTAAGDHHPTAASDRDHGRTGDLHGGCGPTAAGALAALEAGLSSGAESSRRAAAHGLKEAGDAGLGPLVRGIGSDRAPVRRASAAGLGTTAAACAPEAVEALLAALAADPDDLVRSNAAYSLGQVARSASADGNRIAEALIARLDVGAEPDNACNVELSRSTVRQAAAYGLVQVLANHRIDGNVIDRLIDGPLHDPDRYVQGLVVEALARAEQMTPAARKRLVRFLSGRRWNPTPNPGSRT